MSELKLSKTRNTIYSLKPDPHHECSPDDTVAFAVNLMSNHRIHCVIVKDSNGTAVGLFTAKDLALRVVGQSRDPTRTLIKDIMTTNPLCLSADTPITEALELMVKRGVRHLPLTDSNGNIKGVLDITRCFHQAMLRLEKISQSATKLNYILKGVSENYDDNSTLEAQTILNDIKHLSQLIDVPTLSSIVKPSNQPIYIDSSSSVLTAAQTMIDRDTTALLVRDRTSSSRKVIGIFTSKDICFRVLAKGYDPKTCTVARVLTTSLEFAKSGLNISSALRSMYQGHFLNLPVVDDSTNNIIAVISVLELTYSAISQLGRTREVDSNTIQEVTNKLNEESGPVWDRFWSSLERSSDDIQSLEFTLSPTKSPTMSRSQTPKPQSRTSSKSQVKLSNSRRSSAQFRRLSNQSDLQSDLQPNFSRAISSESLTRTNFYLKNREIVFKLRYESIRAHKISMTINYGVSIYDDLRLFDLLKDEIGKKLEIEIGDHDIYYTDNEGDLVAITNEDSLIDAIDSANKQNERSVELIIKPQNSGTLLDYIRTMMRDLKNKFFGAAYFSDLSSFSIYSGTFVVLSFGVIVGFSLSKIRVFLK